MDEPVEEVLVDKGQRCGCAHGEAQAAGGRRGDECGLCRCGAQADSCQAPLASGAIRRSRARSFSCSTFMMYLGIEGRYDDVAHHTIYLAENYKQNLRDIEELHRLSARTRRSMCRTPR